MKHPLLVKIPAVPATSYPVFIDSGLFTRLDVLLPKHLEFSKVVIVTDNTVKKYYSDVLVNYFKKKLYTTLLLSFPAGEKYKVGKTKQALEKKMFANACGRDTLLVALGGGVVGDITGFIAATYMRGIPYIQVPTTLLAMVDSSVGGKTAIDNDSGKNLIGAFWQPQAVIAELQCVRTLPHKQRVNGLIEIIKIFLSHDEKSFYQVQDNLAKILSGDENILKNIIHRAVKIKADIVEQDEKDKNIRMSLNFGHTIGHALEKLSNFKLLHGYAVGLGILVESKISELLGHLDPTIYPLIVNSFEKLGITSQMLKKYDVNKIVIATRLDKKVQTGEINYVLLKAIGEVYTVDTIFAHPVADDVVKVAIHQVIGDN